MRGRGFDVPNDTAETHGSGIVRGNMDSMSAAAEATARLLALPVRAEKPGEPALEDYKIGMCYMRSFAANQHELWAALQAATETSEKDWKVTHTMAEKRLQEGKGRLARGHVAPSVLDMLYGALQWGDGQVYERSEAVE